MITFDSVSKHYHGQHALSKVSFAIERGEMVFLTGHSGAGKSTILKLAMAIEPPTQGRISIHGQEVSQLPRRKIPAYRQHIGMIYQNPQLLANKTVFENVALPLFIRGYRYREMQRRVHAALDKVSLLSKENLTPAELSCGEQQRVGIARAVVGKPDILLADEPTGNLDPLLSLEIVYLFEAFNAVGVTVLIATHDLSLIAQMPYRMITLHNGCVIKKQGAIIQETIETEVS